MIPKSVTRDRLLDALRQIDRDGVPRGRESRGYDLLHDGRTYPPKYVVALAIEAVTGRVADLQAFGGGDETNTFLRGHGFTVLAKGEVVAARSVPVPRPLAPAGGGATVRVARVFLNLGVTMTDLKRAAPKKHDAFAVRQAELFGANPAGYLDRVVSLLRRATASGADVVVLPARALIHGSEGVTLSSYGLDAVPLLVAGEAVNGAWKAIVVRQGVVTERFDDQAVHWVDAGRFTILAAISSTVKGLHEGQEPVRSKVNPPAGGKPVLVIDLGHHGYNGRYFGQTLRCAAVAAGKAASAPSAAVLASWIYATTRPKCPWAQPPERVRSLVRLSGEAEGDVLELLDIDLGGA